jgi:hypothetical protein
MPPNKPVKHRPLKNAGWTFASLGRLKANTENNEHRKGNRKALSYVR